MRPRAAVLVAALLATAAGCVAPGSQGKPEAVAASPRPADDELVVPRRLRARVRADALRRARVWTRPTPPVASADLAANPPGPDTFSPDASVPCTFVLRPSQGWSPKFECVLAGGEAVKVKYGHNSVEVFAEVAASRLLSALGFGADRMYVVREVRCLGCPRFPYPKVEVLDGLLRDPRRVSTFDLAAI